MKPDELISELAGSKARQANGTACAEPCAIAAVNVSSLRNTCVLLQLMGHCTA